MATGKGKRAHFILVFLTHVTTLSYAVHVTTGLWKYGSETRVFWGHISGLITLFLMLSIWYMIHSTNDSSDDDDSSSDGFLIAVTNVLTAIFVFLSAGLYILSASYWSIAALVACTSSFYAYQYHRDTPVLG